MCEHRHHCERAKAVELGHVAHRRCAQTFTTRTLAGIAWNRTARPAAPQWQFACADRTGYEARTGAPRGKSCRASAGMRDDARAADSPLARRSCAELLLLDNAAKLRLSLRSGVQMWCRCSRKSKTCTR